jgi:hypothetical protein
VSGDPRGPADAVDWRPLEGRDEPPVRCPYCDRPFRRDRYERLHRGRVHPDRLSDRERAAFERAVRAEDAAIRRFRLYLLGVLVLSYFGLAFVYAFVT